MRWYLVVPGALVPGEMAGELAAACDVPGLQARLRHAAARPGPTAPAAMAGAAHLHWLARAFGETREPPVTAPYAHAALCGLGVPSTAAPGGGAPSPLATPRWHLSPVHLAVARDHTTVTPIDDPPLAADELAALAVAASEGVAGLGARVECVAGELFAAFDEPLELHTVPLDAALGQAAEPRLPIGADAARWRRLLNGIQVAWHHHPVNRRREEADRQTANGPWLHGGGTWQPLAPPQPIEAEGEDPVLRGWAQAARSDPALPRDRVTVWRGLHEPARAGSWAMWLMQLPALESEIERVAAAAAAAGAAGIELVLCGERATVAYPLRGADRWSPAGLWRGWRRRDGLAAQLAEPAA